MTTAKALKCIGINVIRAGAWKPRTRPGCFEGYGAKALEWMQEAKQDLGVRICTEVACREHVRLALEHGMDMVWIGARTTTNPFLVQEIADALEGTDIPVLVKNPINNDIGLWIGALERLDAAGIRKIAAVHRGVSPLHSIQYRNEPAWGMAIELRAHFPSLSVLVDPSHMTGKREYVFEVSQRALNLGFDGLMIEAHCAPALALSDSAQQLEPSELQSLIQRLRIRSHDSEDLEFRLKMSELRESIDALDDSLLDILAQRMDLCRQIGRIKQEHNISILQLARFEDILTRALDSASGRGLDDKLVEQVFTAIHNASVEVQARKSPAASKKEP